MNIKIPCVRIINPDTFGLLGELPEAASIVFTRRWQTHGEFSVNIPVGARGTPELKIGWYIMLDSDSRRSGVIEQIVCQEQGSNCTLTVSGRSLSSLASARITVPPDDEGNMGWDVVPYITEPQVYPDPVPVETIFKTYVQRHLLTGNDRKTPELTITPDLGRGKTALWMCRWELLDTVLSDIAAYADMGWEITLDWRNKRLLFDVVPGVDRSVGSGISPVIFSSKFGNLESLTYTQGLTNYRNLGYVGGSGEDENRLVQSVWLEDIRPSGRDRREVWIDAGQLDIYDGLIEEGRHKLADYPKTETIQAKVALTGPFEYRRDWDLGDLVTVQTRAFGGGYAELSTRVTEISEHYEPGKRGLDVTFGASAPDLGRVIRQKTMKVVR